MSRRFVPVGAWPTSAEASAARARLDAAGFTTRLEPSGGDAARGGFHVLVVEDDAERAALLLAEEDPDDWVDAVFGDGDARSVDAWTCPTCGTVIGGRLDACWSCGGEREG